MPFCLTDPCDACGCCSVLTCHPDESRCHAIRWICIQCDTVDPDHERDDGLPPGWAENADGEPFCASCLDRSPLDPPEDDQEGG